jgi:hypothetical protein
MAAYESILACSSKIFRRQKLVASWRETLLESRCLKAGPMVTAIIRSFYSSKQMSRPQDAIIIIWLFFFEEFTHRGYNFHRNKINRDFSPVSMQVTTGQISYETSHLLNKPRTRDALKFIKVNKKKKHLFLILCSML